VLALARSLPDLHVVHATVEVQRCWHAAEARARQQIRYPADRRKRGNSQRGGARAKISRW
jgi:hypothetical protein